MFNEENTVEQMLLDTLCGKISENMVSEMQELFGKAKAFWKSEKYPGEVSGL